MPATPVRRRPAQCRSRTQHAGGVAHRPGQTGGLVQPNCGQTISMIPCTGDIYTAHRSAQGDDVRRSISSRSHDALKGDKHVQATGGSAFLAQLASHVPTASNAAQYAADHSRKIPQPTAYRLGTDALDDLASTEDKSRPRKPGASRTKVAGPQPPDQYRQAPAHRGHRSRKLRALCRDSMRPPIRRPSLGCERAFDELDLLLTGLTPGHLMVVAAHAQHGQDEPCPRHRPTRRRRAGQSRWLSSVWK